MSLINVRQSYTRNSQSTFAVQILNKMNKTISPRGIKSTSRVKSDLNLICLFRFTARCAHAVLLINFFIQTFNIKCYVMRNAL